MKSVSSPELDEFKKLLDRTSPADFDGHTEFDRLTPEQRLRWLSECARFVQEAKGPTIPRP